jgi:hypothetical protein
LKISRIDGTVIKTVQDAVWMTHLSKTSAVILCSAEITAREEIRLELTASPCSDATGASLAKILSVREVEGRYEAKIRFTFVSPGMRQLFKSVSIGLPRKKP